MRFGIWDHAGKGGYLREQMLRAGHSPAETLEDADLLLLDCDWRWANPRPDLIRAAVQAGTRVVLYPHGGLPTVFVYDGLTPPDPNVSLRLEHGPGPIQVAERLGLDLSQRAVGWLYTPTRPFRPVEEPRRMLFAPQHPNMEALLNGTLNGQDPGPAINNRIFRELLEFEYDELSVLTVGPSWRNGVFAHPRVRQVSNHEMTLQTAYAEVMRTDVVIAAGTVAALAVACGKPTVMLGQGHYADYIGGRYVFPDNWESYDADLRYPIDAETGDLEDAIYRACEGDEEAADWRERFVGDDGTTSAIEALEELVSADVRVRGVTAKAGQRI